jgi:hypothetical protein
MPYLQLGICYKIIPLEDLVNHMWFDGEIPI